MRQRLDIIKLYTFICKKANSPPFITLWWFTAGECNDMGFDFSGHLRRYRWGLPLLSIDGCFQTLIGVRSSDILYSGRSRMVRLCNLCDGHSLLSVTVRSKEYVGSEYRPGG